MSDSANHATDSRIDGRTRRARIEQMDVWLLQAGGVYCVHSASGRTYRVDVCEKSCTCPDFQKRELSDGCKHLRRVQLELDAGTVPRPDGRLWGREEQFESPDSTLADGEAPAAHEISGPYVEFDRYGDPTGETFFRCSCGREALRRTDLRADGCGGGQRE